MLTRFLFFCALTLRLLTASSAARAQDVIIDLNGNELPGQVIEITPTQVVYRTADADLALPPSVLEKSALFMVRFANGSKEVFTPTTAPTLTTGGTSAPGVAGLASPDGLTLAQREGLRERGRQDALRYYNRTGPFLGTMLGTAATLGGVIPAVVIGVIKPKASKNKLLDPQLLPYPSYVDGYESTARKRKTWPVIGGYVSGLALAVLLQSALSAP